jgi:hypothetical protein
MLSICCHLLNNQFVSDRLGGESFGELIVVNKELIVIILIIQIEIR